MMTSCFSCFHPSKTCKKFTVAAATFLFFLTFSLISLHAQDAEEEKAKEWNSSLLSGLKFRLIGPAITSGRITDIAVHPANKAVWYVTVASGGVWKTANAGTTWEPVFDSEKSYSIGCVTIDPHNPHTIWIGTGENNSQRSVSYGDGVYRSTDGGKSWDNMGLKDSEHIAKIIVHPDDYRTVYVAAQGPLWGPGGDRGLYRTTDAGKTWEAILPSELRQSLEHWQFPSHQSV